MCVLCVYNVISILRNGLGVIRRRMPVVYGKVTHIQAIQMYPNLSRLNVRASEKRQRVDDGDHDGIVGWNYTPHWYLTSNTQEFTMVMVDQNNDEKDYKMSPSSPYDLWSNGHFITTVNMTPCSDRCVAGEAKVWGVTPWNFNDAKQSQEAVQRDIDKVQMKMSSATEWEARMLQWYPILDEFKTMEAYCRYCDLYFFDDNEMESYTDDNDRTLIYELYEYFKNHKPKLDELYRKALDVASVHASFDEKRLKNLYDMVTRYSQRPAMGELLKEISQAICDWCEDREDFFRVVLDMTAPEETPSRPVMPTPPFEITKMELFRLDDEANFESIWDEAKRRISAEKDGLNEKLSLLKKKHETIEHLYMDYIGTPLERTISPILLLALLKLDRKPHAIGLLMVESNTVSQEHVHRLMDAYPWTD